MIWATILTVSGGTEVLTVSTQPVQGWTRYNVTGEDYLKLEEGQIVQLTEQQAQERIAERTRAHMQPLTAAQFFRGLQAEGLLATVTSAVDASGDADLKLLFNRASVYQRADARLNAMAAQLGISQSQLDTYWQEWGQLL